MPRKTGWYWVRIAKARSKYGQTPFPCQWDEETRTWGFPDYSGNSLRDVYYWTEESEFEVIQAVAPLW
jgi:hypothetical protein